MKNTCFRVSGIATGLMAVFGFAGTAGAGLLDVQYDPGLLNTTPSISEFSTTGADMVGMEVTANFTDGGSETAIWTDTSPDAGGAFGTGWSLSVAGDTLISEWSLMNEFAFGIDSLFIDAGAGDTVFDIFVESDHPSTPGSSDGLEFFPTGDEPSVDFVATYSDHVALDGEAPVGDLWRNLEIDFTSPPGLIEGTELTYIADTDNTGPLTPVPEPTGMALLAMGVTGMVLRKKSRV